MTAYHADASDLEGKEILTWETFGDAAEELAAQIHHSGFDPEILIAVARGGMIPGGALTYSLGVKLTDAINVEFYTDVQETLPDPVLLAPMLDTESIRNKRILIVDDVVDSGRTLALVLELAARLRSRRPLGGALCQAHDRHQPGLRVESHGQVDRVSLERETSGRSTLSAKPPVAQR